MNGWLPGCTEEYVQLPDLRMQYFLGDASHWVQLDQPEKVNRLILDWVSR